ncbi:MAG: fused MFS/spermidine synthase [Alphaproteobacteria bacterium]|nr:fused MFS/spermidine synthase [Alphaproteobacteria bacterium]
MKNLKVYAITIFLSSFLLFQVQPIIAKLILPWFGGSSAVWTTCMLFFQISLLGGYAYAHLLTKHLKLSAQPLVHISLLFLSLAFLPIAPDDAWKPVDPQNPVWKILVLLFFSIGAPFLLVASTNPLLQHWIGSTTRAALPYRLYALSNISSLLALISYPFLVEPFIGLREQTIIWSIGYVTFVFGATWCAVQIRKLQQTKFQNEQNTGSRAKSSIAKEMDGTAENPQNSILWFSLSACGVVLLLATTNQMTQDIPPIPFLWILPLSIYLLSFIICFDHSRWYIRGVWVTGYCLSLIPMIFLLFFGKLTGAVFQIGQYSLILFTACMICHGELVRLKPSVRRLTSFYLTMALGGAFGGIFVAVVSPFIFNTYFEFQIGVFCTGLLAWICRRQEAIHTLGELENGRKNNERSKKRSRKKILILKKQRYITIFCGLGGLVLISFFILHFDLTHRNFLMQSRNFYGILGVKASKNQPGQEVRELVDGTTIHGSQIMTPKFRRVATGYFRFDSGIGVSIRFLEYSGPLHMGVIGLGAGTIASYGKKDDVIRFYEINPAVVNVADEYFYFLKDSPADTSIVLGDGRISLERELKEKGSQQFHILAVDAFSNDAPPVHLLTKEAFDLYWKHLNEDGILAFNISNAHLDLSPVVRNLARVSGKRAVFVRMGPDLFSRLSSYWVLVTSNKKFLSDQRVIRHITPWEDSAPEAILWTDDYSNLASVLSSDSGTMYVFERLLQIMRRGVESR